MASPIDAAQPEQQTGQWSEHLISSFKPYNILPSGGAFCHNNQSCFFFFFALVVPDEEAEHSDWEAEPERRPPLTPEDELEQDSEFG